VAGPAATIDAPVSGAARAAVLVDGLTVCYGSFVAVDAISLSVTEQEVFGLLGPNGAGKTTTLRVLTSLLAPSGGDATVAGFDVRRDSLAVRASIGYVPQAISVDAALTARENLDFYARVTGVPRRDRRARIDEAIEAMELEAMLDLLASSLSGGMLRRLEIATALLARPVVLFLDEPTVGLDPTARRLVWERLDALRAQHGTTIVVTTHMMEEAERHCDRLAIMDRGRIVASGTAAELAGEHGVDTLEDVFSAVTGRSLDEAQEGGLAGVRSQRRVARRLG
jgi:ABC-2 type transport system ATP-binding protein